MGSIRERCGMPFQADEHDWGNCKKSVLDKIIPSARFAPIDEKEGKKLLILDVH